jgi:hypothetical protein
MSVTTLAQLIALVESANHPFAVRYEPDYKPQPHHICAMMELAGCNYSTAAVLCAMSWGLYQIMGDMLIALGLACSPFVYMNQPAMQDDFFAKYVAADHLTLTLADVLADPSKRTVFARLYNGPGDVPAYAARMIAVAKANGLTVVE